MSAEFWCHTFQVSFDVVFIILFVCFFIYLSVCPFIYWWIYCTHSNLHLIVCIELNIYPSIHQPMHPAMDNLPINLWSRLSIHSFIPILLPFTHHTHLSTYTPIHLPTHPSPPTYLHTHPHTHLTTHPPTYSLNLTPIHLLTHPFTYPHIFTAFYATIIYWCHRPNHLLIPSIHARFKPTHPLTHPPIHPRTYPPTHASTHPSIRPSKHKLFFN